MRKKARHDTFRILGIFERANKSDRAMTSGLLSFLKHHPDWEIRLLDPRSDNFKEKLRRLALTWQINCIISSTGGTKFLDGKTLRKQNPILIAIDPSAKHRNRMDGAVLIDDDAVAKAAAHLFASRQLTHLAYVATDNTAEAEHSSVREQALGKYAQQHSRIYTFHPLKNRGRKLFDELEDLAAYLKRLPKPCGILAYCDELAIQVMDACHIAQIDVPEQVSLVGVDNETELCESLKPTLSSIMPDFEGAGYLAGKMTLAIVESSRRPKKTLIRRYSVKTVVERESTQDLRGGGRLVNIARAHIAANACTGEGVEKTARALNVSRRLLELRFREITGKTIKEEIAEVRLNNVRKLLRESSRTISDIAYSSGFGTVAAMMVSFKKRFGTTPGNYRKG